MWHEGDAASLAMALAACLLGYGEVGLWLQREAKQPQSWVKIENNPYRKWIEDYSGERYQAAVKVGIGA
jgi:hydroxymethylpyrimidine/phosphomethylpyrimidine kinase